MKILILVLAVAAAAAAASQAWQINPNFNVAFTDRFATGVFESLTGTVEFDLENLREARFDVCVEAASINTGNKLKNKHARSDRWLDANQYPTIRFVSDTIYFRDSTYVAVGKLSLKEATHTVIIPFSFDEAGDSAMFAGSFRIDRSAFGIGKTRGNHRDSTTITLTVPVSTRRHPA